MPVTKESIGEEAYREFQHQAYLRRKAKLEKARELEELEQIKNDPVAFGENTSRSRVFWFYLGLKIGLTLAFTNNRRRHLSDEEKDKVNLWPLDIAQRVVQDNWDAKKIQQRRVRIINERPLPEQETKFFRIISNALDEKEVDVWDYIFRFLLGTESKTKRINAGHIEYETGVSKENVVSALQHLKKLGVIEYEDDKTKPHIADAIPIVIKRGSEWIENEK